MTAPISADEARRHGPYNGWCRVVGIPLKAKNCPLCLAAEVERLSAARQGFVLVRTNGLVPEGVYELDTSADGYYLNPLTDCEDLCMEQCQGPCGV